MSILLYVFLMKMSQDFYNTSHSYNEGNDTILSINYDKCRRLRRAASAVDR
jgi:hypothetical protein